MVNIKVIVLVVACLLAVYATSVSKETPPKLVQQFVSNYTLGAVSENTSFTGQIAVDYLNGGGRISVNGISLIPVYIESNFIAFPSAGTHSISIYWFVQDFCYLADQVPLNDINLFPLKIPERAKYMGEEIIDGQQCSVWAWDDTDKYNANITAYVNEKDSSPVRITLDNNEESEFFGIIQWDFFGTTVGPFNPDTYNPPDLHCPPIDFDSPLLNFFAPLLRVFARKSF